MASVPSCRGGFNDISICDGKEVRDKATMALARDWVTSTQRTRDVPRFRALVMRKNPYVLLFFFLLLDH